MERSSLQIYRDLLRLVRHVAAGSRKGTRLRSMVRDQFRANMYETDPTRIKEMQNRAQLALSNYLVIDSLGKLKKRDADALKKRRPAAAEADKEIKE